MQPTQFFESNIAPLKAKLTRRMLARFMSLESELPTKLNITSLESELPTRLTRVILCASTALV